jgi:hypothetical protein
MVLVYVQCPQCHSSDVVQRSYWIPGSYTYCISSFDPGCIT